MSAGEAPTGDMDDIEQRERAALASRPVPVAVAGAVRSQALPSRSWSSQCRTIDLSDGPVKVASADGRRRSLTLIVDGGPVYVGGDQASCAQAAAARWPAGVALALTHAEEVWVSAATANVTLSAVQELWAD